LGKSGIVRTRALIWSGVMASTL